jgi:hypothetical protein
MVALGVVVLGWQREARQERVGFLSGLGLALVGGYMVLWARLGG